MIRRQGLGILLSVMALCACSSGDEGAKSSQGARDGDAKWCDLDALKALSARVETGAEGVGVLDELENACSGAIPQQLKLALTGQAPSPKQDSAWTELLERTCPGAHEQLAHASELAAAQRSTALYESCKLDRFDLMDAEGAGGLDGTLTIWILHQWLLDQGLSADAAKPISLAALRGQSDAEHGVWAVRPIAELSLPRANADPLSEAPVIYVSRSLAQFDGRKLVDVKDGLFVSRNMGDGADASLLAAQRIPEIFAPLSAAAADQGAALLIVADADLPFISLRDLLRSAADAGFTKAAIAVEAQDGTRTQLSVASSTWAPAAPKAAGGVLAVMVEADANAVSLELGGDEPPRRVDRADLASITAAASEVKTKDPAATRLRVSAALAVPLGRLLEVVQAARGPSCGLAVGECLLTELEIVGERPHMPDANFAGEGVDAGPSQAPVGGEPAVGVPAMSENSHVVGMRSRVLGSLSNAEVLKGLGAHVPKVLGCYEEVLKRQPTLRGELELEFSITPSGAAEPPVISGSLAEASLKSCVSALAQQWQFVAPPDARVVRVTWALELAPGKPKPPPAKPPDGQAPANMPPGPPPSGAQMPKPDSPPPTNLPMPKPPPGSKPTAPPPGWNDTPAP